MNRNAPGYIIYTSSRKAPKSVFQVSRMQYLDIIKLLFDPFFNLELYLDYLIRSSFRTYELWVYVFNKSVDLVDSWNT